MTQKNMDRLQWVVIAIGTLAVAALGLHVYLMPKPVFVPPADPEPVLIVGADGRQYATGRIADPEAAETFRSQQPARWFGDTAAGRAKLAPGDKTVILPQAAMKVLGHFLPARDQGQVGDCVGFGTSTAVEHLMLVQIAGGAPQDYFDISQEVMYAGSRVQIGGGKIKGDGSVGAWAADFAKQDGIVSRAIHGKYDLTKYSEKLARSWGKTGVPADLLPVAKQSPVKGITGIRSADEAVKALAQGYPIAVCSDKGFTTTRDKDGFLKEHGTWGHCQACLGYTDTPRRGFLICNSWGPSWVKGPAGKYPIPDGCYWIEWNTFDSMCRENDTWAFSDAVGFPAKNIDDWFINVLPAPDTFVRGPAPVKEGVECSLAW